MKKLKVLIGIDENYTKKKLIDCFVNRLEYEVSFFFCLFY